MQGRGRLRGERRRPVDSLLRSAPARQLGATLRVYGRRQRSLQGFLDEEREPRLAPRRTESSAATAQGVTPNSSWPDVPAQRRCWLRMRGRGECIPDVAAMGVIQRKPWADSPLLYRTRVGSRIGAQLLLNADYASVAAPHRRWTLRSLVTDVCPARPIPQEADIYLRRTFVRGFR